MEDIALGQRRGGRIAVLDGYRALAVVLVLAYHFTVRWAPARDPLRHLPAGAVFSGVLPLEYGWTGVHLFFVISGFVIMMTLERCSSVVDFALHRFARLWPALVVSALLSWGLVDWIGPQDWHVGIVDFAESMTLVDPSLFARQWPALGGHWVDGAYWSLEVEVHFYVLAGLVFLIARRHFLRNLLIVLFGIIAIYMLCYRWREAAAFRAFCHVFFPYYAPYFALGVCNYAIYTRREGGVAAVVGATLAVAVLIGWSVTAMVPFVDHPVSMGVVSNLVIVALFWLFLADSPVVRPLAARPVVALGQASYSLYLLHQNIGVTLIARAVSLGVAYLIALPVVMIALVALALAMFRFVEVPAKNFVLRRTKGVVQAAGNSVRWLNYRSR